MQVSLDKLLSFNGNKYVFSKAAMKTIEKIANVKGYKEEENQKIVIKALNLMLEEKVKFEYIAGKAEE
ncbi:MAG: hypothetical protein JXN64_08995 [Spirochaetes bacterium]|nr:hypothetical protein [Spirochaetota bacterium]